jgi:predicted alpha/beta-fold hydrolase
MHFRGCSGEPNRLDRSYHSGETGDVDSVVRTLLSREPRTPLAVVGFSLGGNVLLKWLAEKREDAGVAGAVAVSVPFVLGAAARRLNQGLSRTYQWLLLRNLHNKLRVKFRNRTAPIDLERLASWRTFELFDHHVTAKLHGFEGVEDYYRRSSSRQYLADIAAPTLIVHARDDPFMTPEVIPSSEELSPTTRLEVSRTGGHVGFVAGTPWRPRYWLEERTIAFLRTVIRDS